MAELKTKKNDASVSSFLASIKDKQMKEDAAKVSSMMQRVTKAKPKMWGNSIVGFGDKHLVYESGRELDWFIMGFSPRKQALTLYLMGGLDNPDMDKLGEYKKGKGCLYIKKLSDIDINVLEKVMKECVLCAKNDKINY